MCGRWALRKVHLHVLYLFVSCALLAKAMPQQSDLLRGTCIRRFHHRRTAIARSLSTFGTHRLTVFRSSVTTVTQLGLIVCLRNAWILTGACLPGAIFSHFVFVRDFTYAAQHTTANLNSPLSTVSHSCMIVVWIWNTACCECQLF